MKGCYVAFGGLACFALACCVTLAVVRPSGMGEIALDQSQWSVTGTLNPMAMGSMNIIQSGCGGDCPPPAPAPEAESAPTPAVESTEEVAPAWVPPPKPWEPLGEAPLPPSPPLPFPPSERQQPAFPLPKGACWQAHGAVRTPIAPPFAVCGTRCQTCPKPPIDSWKTTTPRRLVTSSCRPGGLASLCLASGVL